MKKTKDRISDTALDLFNEHGIKETTLRKIAIKMGISQGNLNYHFKTKQILIEKLYFDLVLKMDQEMAKLNGNQAILQVLFDSAEISIQCLYNYRFLMRDFHKVMNENETLKSHYFELQQVRSEQFNALFTVLQVQNLIRKEEFENEYDRLFLRMNILGDNWINTQELLNQDQENPVQYYHLLLFEVLYPYLTNRGKKEYNELTIG